MFGSGIVIITASFELDVSMTAELATSFALPVVTAVLVLYHCTTTSSILCTWNMCYSRGFATPFRNIIKVNTFRKTAFIIFNYFMYMNLELILVMVYFFNPLKGGVHLPL